MDLKKSHKIGFSFGLTSGVITTLGLLIGLATATNSRLVAIGGVLTIAIADALSDSFGIHVSEEARGKSTSADVLEATISTFLYKFLTAVSFLIPIVFLSLNYAVIASIVWGFFLISLLSFYIAKTENTNYRKVILEHILIATIVIVVSYYVGLFVSSFFVV